MNSPLLVGIYPLKTKNLAKTNKNGTRDKHLGIIWYPSDGINRSIRNSKERYDGLKQHELAKLFLLFNHSCFNIYVPTLTAGTKGKF